MTRDLRFMLFGTDSETGKRVLIDIVEPWPRYNRKTFRSFSLLIRTGEATDFTVGSVQAWPYDQRTISKEQV